MPAQLPPDAGVLVNIRDILVPCDGSAISYSALALACDVAHRNKGQVYAVHVIVVKRSLPLDADMVAETRRGNDILEKAEQIGAASGQLVQTELLQARDTGTSIADEAGNLGVDAIFIGLELKERIAEPTVGVKIDHLLQQARCQVWIFRDAMPADGSE